MNWKFKVLCYAYILPIEYVLQSNLHWSNFLEIGYSFDSPQCAFDYYAIFILVRVDFEIHCNSRQRIINFKYICRNKNAYISETKS